MNILVIGSGGREHAIAWKVKQSPLTTRLYCAPGNPGMESLATCVPISPTDMQGLLQFARQEGIDLTIVGPEQPLADGIVDLFDQHGLTIFGPTKRAAELEWSKVFAKQFMVRNGIPTARFQTFGAGERNKAIEALQSSSFPVVLKADGLAAGKGVVICDNRTTAMDALHGMMDERAFGSASDTVVLEEFMIGEEASVFAVCDGTDFVTLAPAQDHKRIHDNDEGKNTGGMGAYAPAPVVTVEWMKHIGSSIIGPTLKGMMAEGRPYKGCLYVGLMMTAEGPKVIEYNSRFGDPETQAVLPLYRGDIVELLLAASKGRLGAAATAGRNAGVGSAVCVVLASAGYPDAYPTGKEIHGLEDLPDGVVAFHAGTKRVGTTIVTHGGRVLGLTAMSDSTDIEKTIRTAYGGVARISFDGMQYRSDIGKKALSRIAESVS